MKPVGVGSEMSQGPECGSDIEGLGFSVSALRLTTFRSKILAKSRLDPKSEVGVSEVRGQRSSPGSREGSEVRSDEVRGRITYDIRTGLLATYM